MENDKGFLKILTWAGIIALVALPVFMVIKKRKSQEADSTFNDNSNIFATELEE